MLTGQPMSTLLAAPERGSETPYRFVPIALEPSDRGVLHARIAERFDAMLANGFIDEVRRLRERGDLDPGLPSMRCVGYRQAWEYLEGAIDYATMRDKGIFATRQLCKRQLTWLRSMPERIVIDCCAPSATDDALRAVEAIVNRNKRD
jgi:tRNA dimethylallyltransferase